MEEKGKALEVTAISEEKSTVPAVTTVLAAKGNTLEVINIPEEEMLDNE